MATKVKKKAPDILEEVAKKNDWTQLLEQIRQNPVLYGAGAAFVLLCVVAGLLYRSSARSTHDAAMSAYARAMENEDPSLRTAELENVSKGKGEITALALYMQAESAFEAKQYDKAREAYERLRKDYPDSAKVPEAVEAMGNLSENDKQYDKALASYQEIVEKWPTTFVARRQQLNIGRCQEQLGKLAEAVAAYQAQTQQFPGSETEKEAKDALDRLRKTNPELFPKEEAKPAEGVPAASSAAAQEKPAEQTPAEKPAETPAQPAPAQQ